jgi:hypothetical protein
VIPPSRQRTVDGTSFRHCVPRLDPLAANRLLKAADRLERFQLAYATHREDAWCAMKKVMVLNGCDSRPATGSLQPVAIGAAVEVTKPSEPSRQMCRFWRCSEQAGRNASERRAGLETTNVDADPATWRGRPQPLASKETAGIRRPTSDPTQRATGVMTTACLYKEINATWETPSREGA